MFWEPDRECLYLFTVNQRKCIIYDSHLLFHVLILCFTGGLIKLVCGSDLKKKKNTSISGNGNEPFTAMCFT